MFTAKIYTLGANNFVEDFSKFTTVDFEIGAYRPGYSTQKLMKQGLGKNLPKAPHYVEVLSGDTIVHIFNKKR
jgi:hypothetical protein